MPVSAPRPCVGCGQLVRGSSRCDECTTKQRKQYDDKRLSSTARGYDGRWRKIRLIYLSAHPLCVRCEDKGIVRPATVVDHIIPHKGSKQLFNDPNNFQSLCKPCHDTKTATEDGGGWRG